MGLDIIVAHNYPHEPTPGTEYHVHSVLQIGSNYHLQKTKRKRTLEHRRVIVPYGEGFPPIQELEIGNWVKRRLHPDNIYSGTELFAVGYSRKKAPQGHVQIKCWYYGEVLPETQKDTDEMDIILNPHAIIFDDDDGFGSGI